VKDIKEEKKLSARELPVGDILEAGSAKQFKTGDWKTSRPVWNEQKCIHCLSCWVACPDSAIKTKDGKITGIDLEHCKGCGICAKECPVKISAIVMEKEKK
jgi:pyruvate ferredoxin oxidoreductase delta subunit